MICVHRRGLPPPHHNNKLSPFSILGFILLTALRPHGVRRRLNARPDVQWRARHHAAILHSMEKGAATAHPAAPPIRRASIPANTCYTVIKKHVFSNGEYKSLGQGPLAPLLHPPNADLTKFILFFDPT